MKKIILITILSLVVVEIINAQRKPIQVETSFKKLSKVRAMMNHTDIVRINKDWSLEVEFRFEARAEKIGDVLPILKRVLSKKLVFE